MKLNPQLKQDLIVKETISLSKEDKKITALCLLNKELTARLILKKSYIDFVPL
jgi:hypothetical protein